jgi:hypothetical protein
MHIFLPLSSMVPVTYVLILTNNWLGYILGDFIKNSSGHPEAGLEDIYSAKTLGES